MVYNVFHKGPRFDGVNLMDLGKLVGPLTVEITGSYWPVTVT